MFNTILGWLDMAKELNFDHDPKKKAMFAKIDLGVLEKEIKELQPLCEASGSALVFSHNDLLSGNILIVQVGI